MIKTVPVAVDGIHIKQFRAGVTYDENDGITNRMAKILIEDCRAAILVRERTAPSVVPEVAPSEKAVIEEAPERKLVEVTIVEKPIMVRVYQLSDELGVSSKRILEIAKSIGIEATAPASGLSFNDADKIKSELEKLKR